jgi:hypothetical protein
LILWSPPRCELEFSAGLVSFTSSFPVFSVGRGDAVRDPQGVYELIASRYVLLAFSGSDAAILPDVRRVPSPAVVFPDQSVECLESASSWETFAS